MESTKTKIDWLKLAKQIAGTLRKTYSWIEFDELVSLASYALMEAYEKFDKTKMKEKDITAWLFKKGRWKTIDLLRANDYTDRHKFTRHKYVRGIIFNECWLTDKMQLASGEAPLTRIKEIAIKHNPYKPASCYDLLQGLNKREKVICLLYFDEEWTMSEIAKVFFVTESMVSHWRSEALTRLRKLRHNELVEHRKTNRKQTPPRHNKV